jgi:peptidoglycan hydrolase CwlO-like protein
MVDKKVKSNKEHNNEVFSKIKSLQSDIDKLKLTLKPVEAIKNATLEECNAISRKGRAK